METNELDKWYSEILAAKRLLRDIEAGRHDGSGIDLMQLRTNLLISENAFTEETPIAWVAIINRDHMLPTEDGHWQPEKRLLAVSAVLGIETTTESSTYGLMRFRASTRGGRFLGIDFWKQFVSDWPFTEETGSSRELLQLGEMRHASEIQLSVHAKREEALEWLAGKKGTFATDTVNKQT